MKTITGVVALIFALLCGDAHAQEPFFAPPAPTGSIEVRLHPIEGVAQGVPTLVTFGVPFPRGSITQAGLATLRVRRGGVEIPAYVGDLTPWRHRSNAALDGASVRVARVQIQVSFAVAFPQYETITVEWGGSPRTLDVPTLVNPRSAWRLVQSGTFVASDNVFEPDVYAVLPADWLVRGALKSSRSTALDAGNTEGRDSPAANDAIAHWPAYQEAERALKNNFYTEINRDDPLVPPGAYAPYRTEREPWLYDRSATMFVLYMRSGFFTALREGVRAAQYYANRTDAQGFFDLAAGDAKYAYNECFAYTYWLTGDDAMVAKIGNATLAHDGFAHAWTPARNFWTERHAAFKLLANVVAYEVLGGSARRDAIEQILADYRVHQDGANGAIPGNRIDGGLYHYGEQHDYDWDETSLGGSSWMSVLLADAAVRAYASGEDDATARFLARLGNFLRATIVTTEEHSYDTYDGALALPRYGMLLDGSDGQRNFEDVEHALDVAGQLAWADYFARVRSTPDPALGTAALALYATYDEGVNFWIRPGGPSAGLPAFRVSPWRKWGWEHRTSDGLAFALSDGAPPVFEDGFETRVRVRRSLQP